MSATISSSTYEKLRVVILTLYLLDNVANYLCVRRLRVGVEFNLSIL